MRSERSIRLQYLSRREIVKQSNEILEQAMASLGYSKKRKGVFVRHVGPDGIVYVFARFEVSKGAIVIRPLLALENTRLRKLIGEDSPNQLEPRFLHTYISYLVKRAVIFWEIKNLNDARDVVLEIKEDMSTVVGPFAERCVAFRHMLSMLRSYLRGKAAQGLVCHVPIGSDAVIQQLSL